MVKSATILWCRSFLALIQQIHSKAEPNCCLQHYDAFLELCKAKLQQFYGADVQKAADFGRIVSTMHCQRLKVSYEY